MIGKTISHYTILEELGRGGMGVVYKAHDTRLDRTVALKFLPPPLHASEQDKARFLQEAKAAAALNHPNICTVIDFQEWEAPPVGNAPAAAQMFIVMEHVEGRTLYDVLHGPNAGPLQIKQALDIGIQIAEGLAAAHERGIVHRDIKPENIMVRRDGIVQIMDFGLAKLRSSRATRLTEAGSTLGTAGYMSPEQVQGQEVDHRSDIFSLGVVLYELFTGQLPFKGIHSAALTYEIVNTDPPPVTNAKPGLDPDLDRIVAECLQKDPADRYQAAAEVAKELRRVRRATEGGRGGRAATVREGAATSDARLPSTVRRPLGRVSAILALVLAFAVVTGVLVMVLKPWGEGRVSPQQAERFVLTFPQHCALDLRSDGLAISPDGRRLAFIVRQDTASQIYLRDIDSFDARPLTSASGLIIRGLFFSPDGQQLGFFANGKLMALSLGGGSPLTICDALWGEASWGEGGNIVFMQTWGSHLWIVSSEPGSMPRPLTQLHPESGERAHLLPAVLPGGNDALFTIWRGGAYQDNLIAVVNLKTGLYHTVLNGGSAASYSPTGHVIFTRGATLMAAPFDVKGLKVTGEPVPVVEHVLTDGDDAHAYFSVSANGTLVYAPGDVEFSPTTVAIVDRAGKRRLLSSPSANFGLPSFSPDATKLAVEIFGPTYQIGVYDLKRNVLTALTFAGDNLGSTWLPDGSRLTFLSNMRGQYQAYTVAADGSDTPQMLMEQELTPPPPPHAFTWRADGASMVFVSLDKENGSDLWLYSRSDTPSVRPLIATSANEENPRFSPDGHWIAYVSNESGMNQVYVQPFPMSGGRWRISENGGFAPVWGPGGRTLLFQRGNDIVTVPVTTKPGKNGLSLVVGREKLGFSCPGLLNFDISPDGRTLAIAQTSTSASVDHLNIVVHWNDELRLKFSSQNVSASR